MKGFYEDYIYFTLIFKFLKNIKNVLPENTPCFYTLDFYKVWHREDDGGTSIFT